MCDVLSSKFYGMLLVGVGAPAMYDVLRGFGELNNLQLLRSRFEVRV